MSTVLKPRPLPDAPSLDAVGGHEDQVTLYDLETLVVRWQINRRTLLDYINFGYVEAVRFGRGWKVKPDVVKRIDNEGIVGQRRANRLREQKAKK